VLKQNKMTQLNPFIGDWQYQSGNEIFIVTLWLDTAENDILGHYKKIIVDINGVFQSEIYNSNKEIGTSGQNWPRVISAIYHENSNTIGGNITDNTLVNTPRGFHDGKFVLIVQESNCLGCPTTAEWEVEKSPGFRSPDEPDFNIPTDIILTKVN
jgi:hypothetical protein